jgi:two-component system response regulator AtoC
MPPAILLIEDNVETARLMSRTLEDAACFDVTPVCSAHAGLEHLGQHPVDCVLLDYRLPDADGLSCLRTIRQRHPDLPVIFVTGAGSEEIAVEAMHLGAKNYVTKHGRYLPKVLDKVHEALGSRELANSTNRGKGKSRTRRVSTEARARYARYGIVGRSAAIETTILDAERAAATSDIVLLDGETGTGKDVFAHVIHAHSPRSHGPFVVQNCAALPESLLESELFGYVRGAFTGADHAHPGLFEQADGGTLFLDEMSAASLNVQAKLLRVLEDGAIKPLGARQSRTVDVRVIASTNRDLREAGKQGLFRPDLYYRLEQCCIRLPPLRERKEDIPLLAQHFLRELREQKRTALRTFAPTTLRALDAYGWPGNVRELKSEIHRIVSRAESGSRITTAMLSPWIAGRSGDGTTADDRPLKAILREVEGAVIHARLREHGYHRTDTARSLGLTRESLWAKIRQLGLKLPLREGGEE